MITPPEALVQSINEKSFNEIMLCMYENAEAVEVIERVTTIIKLELDKYNFPYTKEEVRNLAITVAITFIEALDQGKASNDEPNTLH